MKATWIMRLGMAAGSILLVAPLLAQGPGGGRMGGQGFGERQPPMERAFGQMGGMGQWWNNPRIVAQLKLTDDQRKAMDGILLDHREQLIDLRASLEKAELEMQPLVSADQPDEGKILAQIDKAAQARAELEKANARFLLAIRAKLTPDQWKQVQAFRDNRGGMERRTWGPGGPGQGRMRPGGDGHPRPNWHPGGPNGPQGQPQGQPPAQQGAPPSGAPPSSGFEQ